jgi:manganese oxidase
MNPHDDRPGHSAAHEPDRAGMGGLILGVTVVQGTQAAPGEPSAKPRQLRLDVRERPASPFSAGGMGEVILEAGEKENSDPPPLPGKPLLLVRGEPVAIEIRNQLKRETAVHWHGIELQSYYDGVAGWGGHSEQTTPPILPGQSFVARFTPPRAGTFIYHTHWHDIAQLTGGLYGPLLVLEPGEKYDPEVDHIFLISSSGPDDVDNPRLLNGSAQPPPLVLKRGAKHRLRFINIGANNSDTDVSLLDAGGKVVQWRAVAKDGWTLPAAMASLHAAKQRISVGETYDFEFTPDSTTNFTLDVAADFLQMKLSQMIVVK